MVHLRHRNLLQTMAATIFPPFYRRRAAREQYSCRFIVTVRRGNNISAVLSSPRGAETIFLPFYRHRAAREQYFRVLSSPRDAETIFLPFYRHRAARKQYLCHFIVTVRRGNDIFAVLSSPCSAGTIFPRFIVTAQRGNDIFAFQCLQCSCKYIPERFWLLQANCERSEMWREPREDGGGPHAEGKMKSSHSK